MRYAWATIVSLVAALYLTGLASNAQESKARDEAMKLIRREKFDLVLPGAMRDNRIDMWIHVIRRGDPDPLELDLGGNAGCPSPSLATRCLGYYVFTDRGGDRIERALFNISSRDEKLFDSRGRVDELGKFVAERDPKSIAVNMSEWLTVADGLSHTGYLTLVKLLGDKYAKRLVSAENVINDFRVRRVQSELVAFAKASEIAAQIMEGALARIVPGVTTNEELGWWARDQLLARGLTTERSGPSAPTTLALYPRPPQGGVYRRGDIVVWDWSISYLNYGTDFKRHGYVLRENETEIPNEIRESWEQVLKARAVIRRELRIGRTAGDTLKAVARALEESGFSYIPNDPTADGGLSGLKPGEHLKNPKKTEVSVDFHSVGETGDSQVAVGPSIAEHRPDRAKVMIQPNNLISFEFIAYVPVPGLIEQLRRPEYGEKLRWNFEENVVITNRGVEPLYPLEDRLIVIR